MAPLPGRPSGSSFDGTVQAWVQNPVRKDCFISRYGKRCGNADLSGFDQQSTMTLPFVEL